MSSLKDEFLATLSHELRTPLSAILGWSQVLRLRRMSPEEIEHGLDAISTFIVHLPMTIIHASRHDEDRVHPRTEGGVSFDFVRADLSGLRILIVDDEPDARELMRRVLMECRAEVLVAGTADAALEFIQRERPDVLVSDIGMPDIDGYELLRRVRALGNLRGGRLPAIALTAFARSEDAPVRCWRASRSTSPNPWRPPSSSQRWPACRDGQPIAPTCRGSLADCAVVLRIANGALHASSGSRQLGGPRQTAGTPG